MNPFYQQIKANWLLKLNECSSYSWRKSFEIGDFGKEHYMSIMRETYYQAGMNPQLQGYITPFLGRTDRDLHKKFFKHATSEIGHDLLALKDYEALGGEKSNVINGRPLPETTALTAYPFFGVQFNGPLAYLGYLFHLEHFPVEMGKAWAQTLGAKGVGPQAMSFVSEHATVDVGHTQLMQGYVEALVKTEDDCLAVQNHASDVCVLHHNMLQAAFDRPERAEKI